MDNPQFKKLTSLTAIQIFFTGCALAIILYNTAALYKEIRLLGQIRRQIPYIFMGNKFLGLNTVLKSMKYVGYYTDKNLDENKPALQFAQAQYILAPIILDLNNTHHPFVLFDCSSEEVALQKIKENGLTPIKRNQFGIILARHLENNRPSNSKPNLHVPLFPKMTKPF